MTVFLKTEGELCQFHENHMIWTGLTWDHMFCMVPAHKHNICSNTIKGHKVPFLRQADDFSVACVDENICEEAIENTGKHLTAPLHPLG